MALLIGLCTRAPAGSTDPAMIRSFKEVVEGKHDNLPEQAFYMQGGIDEVLEAGQKLKDK